MLQETAELPPSAFTNLIYTMTVDINDFFQYLWAWPRFHVLLFYLWRNK